ncbi:MAG: (2Fe-2S)-binding protein [Dehalococcoidia bacterium]|nr:(2Fe-2S)-binding protein [Dehalococcoidia bacterium]
MPQEIKKNGMSRREFLKDAGLVVGGATIGSMTFLSSCGGKTTTVTTTVTGGATRYIDPIDGSEWPSLEALQAHFNATWPNAALSGNLVVLSVNGRDYGVYVNPSWPLAYVLREKMGFFGVKTGCDMGQCGTCTILVDDVPMFSCLMLAIDAGGKKITTVEGLSDGIRLSPLQQKFVDNDAFQCGYCTPGYLMACTALLASNPRPSADDVREAIAGHICMCANAIRVVNTVTGGV